MLPNTETPGVSSGSGTPNPNSGGQPSTTSSVDEATVKALRDLLMPEIDRKIQSTKDKRIAGLQGQMGEFEQKLARLKQLQEEDGYTEAQALRVMDLEERAQTTNAQNGTPPTNSGDGTPNAVGSSTVDESVIRAFGLDPNDPRVANAIRTQTGAELLTTLAGITRGSVIPAGPGQRPPIIGASAGTETVEQITAELERLQANPSKNMAKIQELGGKLEALLR